MKSIIFVILLATLIFVSQPTTTKASNSNDTRILIDFDESDKEELQRISFEGDDLPWESLYTGGKLVYDCVCGGYVEMTLQDIGHANNVIK